MAKVLGAVKPVIQNVNEAVMTPVRNEVVTGVKEAVKTIVSGPSKIPPQKEQQALVKRQQEAISRRFYLKRWVEQLTAQEKQLKLAATAKERQQQISEEERKKKVMVPELQITDNPLIAQPKRQPGLPWGGVKQKQTAFERTKKAA